MKWFLSVILLLSALSVPSFAQLAPVDSVINPGVVTHNVVLNSSKRYLISGFVYIDSTYSITIPAGTLLFGEKSTKGTLVITRGAKIYSMGTAQNPVIFTSQQPAGSRAAGDWGGVIVLGEAPNNQGNNQLIEGGVGEYHGGTNPHDNSGIIQYTRIEYPGIAFEPNNEINGLTSGSVGDGTTYDHVQVSYSGDDSYEFFGGAVNAKYLIAYKGLDDDFDTDNGFSGKLQFGLSWRDPQIADVSKSESFESDNDANGDYNTPRTSPTITNFTAVGPKRHSTDVSGAQFNSLFYYGVHQRRATKQNIFNSVLMGWDEGGIILDGTPVMINMQSDSSKFNHNFIAGSANGGTTGTIPSGFVFNTWYSANSNTTLTEPNDVQLKNPYNSLNPICIPLSTSPLLGAASFSDSKLSDPFFTPVTYAGAFEQDGNKRWDYGWTNYDPQSTLYGRTYDWSSTIQLTNDNNETRWVVIGRIPGATDGLDVTLGEVSLPPSPPNTVPDIRLILPSSSTEVSLDLRNTGTVSGDVVFQLKFQGGSTTNLTLNWDPNLLGAGTFTLKDGLGGVVFPDVDMKTTASKVLPNSVTSAYIYVTTKFNSTISVQNGWNIVSFPGVHPNSMNVDTLWRGRDISANVFRFNGSYQSVSSMVNGEGYWLKMAGNRVYTWNGTVQGGILYPKLNYVPRSPFNGALGWNLIGSYEYIADPNFVRTAPENKRTGFIFEYTPGTGYQVAASLNPGKGYWIQLTAAAEIYIPGPYSGTLSKSPADEYINKDWGRITITDAQGSNYVLYTVTENGINLDIFNLPPLPPANQFDVRFGSQRFVENLNGQTQMLNLTGVVYPVTIKADGINLHLEDPITGKIINTNIADGKEFTLNDSRLNVLKVSSDKITPNRYSLEQNYPNPFNPSTVIKFSVPSTSIVKLTIYNALGQKVSELVNSVLEAGTYNFNWDASKVASGIYFYQLEAGNYVSVKKMMLIK